MGVNDYIPDWTEDDITRKYLDRKPGEIARCPRCGEYIEEDESICEECFEKEEDENEEEET